MQAQVVTQVQGIELVVARIHVDEHQGRRRLLLGGNAVLANRLGQARKGLADPVLHAHGGRVRVDLGVEGDHHLQGAVGTGNRLHVDHVFYTGDRLFQRDGDRIGDFFGVGARIRGFHYHGGRHYFRVFADRQQRNCDQASGENNDRQHHREDGSVDKKLGKVHNRSLWRLVIVYYEAGHMKCVVTRGV